MANIQEAAKWLQEGFDIERESRSGEVWLTPFYPLTSFSFSVVCANGRDRGLDTKDLLADDWRKAVAE